MKQPIQLMVAVVIAAIVSFSVATLTRKQDQGAPGSLRALLKCMRLEEGVINGVVGPHLIIEGCNVHIQSGSGDSFDGYAFNTPPAGTNNCGNEPLLTGLGNLFIGYNEATQQRVIGVDPEIPLSQGQVVEDHRCGSHNLVVGAEHAYTGFGAMVGGYRNEAGGSGATVLGGFNVAGRSSREDDASLQPTVTGGTSNHARGLQASISGGNTRLATGLQASVSGGLRNVSRGLQSSISGGRENIITDGVVQASISGGEDNEARGDSSSVSGGIGNEAVGAHASVSGGQNRTAPASLNWAAGSLLEPN